MTEEDSSVQNLKEQTSGPSPRWGSNTKLIIGLTGVAIIAVLVVQFRQIIAPLILAIILAYLLQPIASFLTNKAHFPWRTAVAVIFLIIIVLLLGIFTLAGFAIVQQFQSLIGVFQQFFTDLPTLINELSKQSYVLGPFQIDLSQFDFTSITNQLLSYVQSFLGQLGSILSTVATQAISVFGWIFFIIIIAYFLLAESGQVRENILKFDIPGFDADFRRLGNELTNVWNIYLRSQLVIFILVIILYYLLMTILGMRFTFGIALMAGLARFIPYIGPAVVWITTALVAYFNQPAPYGLEPWVYTLIVVILAVLLDQVFDQYIQPRLMGRALGLHPAAILIAALIALQLLGIIGLVLAAPVLATVTLVVRYVIRKMLDMNPWPAHERDTALQVPHERAYHRVRAWYRWVKRKH